MAEVEPGPPPVGLAASVSLVSLCDPVVAKRFSDPWSMVLPPSKWPEKVPKAIVHCTSEEWAKLCHLLFDRCMIRTMALRAVFNANGQPVFIGAFAGEKKGNVPDSLSRITRLKMNCFANADMRSLVVDLKNLLGACGWCSFVMWNGAYIFWSSDDMKGA